jgi:putative hemolysin
MPTGSEVFAFAAVNSPVTDVVERITGLNALSRIYDQLPRDDGEASFFERAQRALGIACDVTAEELDRIPRSGPVVVVANHPFGAAEGIVLARILGAVRDDVRLLANHLVGRIPEMRESLILVDPFRPGPSSSNIGGLRRAVAHLAAGGMLATFPAGTVSHLQMDRMAVADPPWNPAIARMVRMAKATVLPVYFPGRNGFLFQLAGLLHPGLRTAMLPHALLERRHSTIDLRIGSPIPFSRLDRSADDERLIGTLRRRTYILAKRSTDDAPVERREWLARVAPPRPARTLAREVAALPKDSVLASNGELDVILASADRIPHVLHEIARLREVTFRQAGEGSGRHIDLDGYDAYYRHLFLWNREKSEVAGAYRLGTVGPILDEHGLSGLYTSTLFRYSPPFLDHLGPHAMEMGRSWIRSEYQKSYTPLLLLWKGIGAQVVRNPDSCILFGPASISNDYCAASRALMARYLMDHAAAHELVPHVAARTPFRLDRGMQRLERAASLDELGDLVQEIENGRRAVPVLVRQYLNIGGRVARLNVDPKFSSTLDALVVVDLRRTPEKTLARYMTPEGARAFLAYHDTKRPD